MLCMLCLCLALKMNQKRKATSKSDTGLCNKKKKKNLPCHQLCTNHDIRKKSSLQVHIPFLIRLQIIHDPYTSFRDLKYSFNYKYDWYSESVYVFGLWLFLIMVLCYALSILMPRNSKVPHFISFLIPAFGWRVKYEFLRSICLLEDYFWASDAVKIHYVTVRILRCLLLEEEPFSRSGIGGGGEEKNFFFKLWMSK